MTKLEKIAKKIFSLDDFEVIRTQLKSEKKKLVFTNGCFDILHLGHVSYLAQAAELGDCLVVGLNDDQSVRSLNKGIERPVNPEHARATLLAALSFVDAVVIFAEQTPLELIKVLQPDVLVKGSDYDANETNPAEKTYIVGSREVRNYGGVIKTIDLVPNFSTTKILSKNKS